MHCLVQTSVHIQVSTPSDFRHFLSTARAPGVRSTGPGDGILGDEVEHVAQWAVHTVFEASAQAHIQQRVEATVEVSQPEC